MSRRGDVDSPRVERDVVEEARLEELRIRTVPLEEDV